MRENESVGRGGAPDEVDLDPPVFGGTVFDPVAPLDAVSVFDAFVAMTGRNVPADASNVNGGIVASA